jgi:5-methylcytosine-specific restriction endonuclease McrA
MRSYLRRNPHKRLSANERRRRLRKTDGEYREKVQAQQRISYAKRKGLAPKRKVDPEKARIRFLRWKEKNREHYLEYQRKYAEQNAKQNVSRVAKWKKDNPEKAKANASVSDARRRARVTLNGGDLEAARTLIAQWKSCKTFRCVYCNKRLSTSKLEVDHVIPLARGGSHSPENLAKSCGPCNRAKGASII